MNDNKNKLTPNPSNKVDFIFPIELSSLSVSSYLLRFTVVEPIDSVVLSRKLIVVELASVSFTKTRRCRCVGRWRLWLVFLLWQTVFCLDRFVNPFRTHNRHFPKFSKTVFIPFWLVNNYSRY